VSSTPETSNDEIRAPPLEASQRISSLDFDDDLAAESGRKLIIDKLRRVFELRADRCSGFLDARQTDVEVSELFCERRGGSHVCSLPVKTSQRQRRTQRAGRAEYGTEHD
jgi:hypothetical protein